MTQARGGKAGPVGLALTAMASIQVGAALAKDMFAAVGAQGAVTMRVVLATAILMAVLRPWRTPIAWREWRLVLPYGAVLGLMNLCFYSALRTVPLGVAVALEFTGPLAVAVIASHRWLDLLWVALAVLGIALMHAPDTTGPIDPQGAAYALGAGAFWALYIVFGKRASVLGSARAAALGLAVAMLVVVPVSSIRLSPSSISRAARRAMARLAAKCSRRRRSKGASPSSWGRAMEPWRLETSRESTRGLMSRRTVSKETSRALAKSATEQVPCSRTRLRIWVWRLLSAAGMVQLTTICGFWQSIERFSQITTQIMHNCHIKQHYC